MKTTTLKNKKKNWLPILLLAIGMFSTSALWACTASFTYTLGLNGRVTFTSNSTGTDASTQYYWNPCDYTGGTSTGNVNTFTHTFTSNGTFPAFLYITDSAGSCSDSIHISVVVNNVTIPCELSANFTYTVNAHGEINCTSTSTGTNGGTQYYWNAGDGSSTTQGTNSFSYTYPVQENYPVTLIIKDTGSAYCVDSITNYIQVNTADSNMCGLHANFIPTLGLNGHVSFESTNYTQDSANFGITYNWTPGDGSPSYSSYDSIYNHIYTANGTYTVSLVVQINYPYGCVDSVAIPITISNVTIPCTLSAAFTVVNDTTTGQVQLSSISSGTYAGTQYYWKQTDSSAAVLAGSSYTTTYGANGSFNAWLIIKDTGTAFCMDSISEIVNISNVDSLHASFVNIYSSDTLGNYTYTFMSTSTGTNDVVTYAWEPGDTTAGDTGVNLTSYTHQYKYPGMHTVTLSVWFSKYPEMPHHKAESVTDMYDFSTYSKTIDVGPPTGINTIADAGTGFKLYPTPNNGSFRLAMNGIENIENAEVEITNILGEVVYTTTASVSNGTIVKDINLPSVSNGTYFVRVIISTNVYNAKTVINR